jgi:TPR repeat protein
MKKVLIILCAVFFLQGCASAVMSQEFQQGKLEFRNGDYQTAFKILLPIAVNGNKEAQYAVGYMYYNGMGVSQDSVSGLFWMERAAAKGYTPAAEALNKLHAESVTDRVESCPVNRVRGVDENRQVLGLFKT